MTSEERQRFLEGLLRQHLAEEAKPRCRVYPFPKPPPSAARALRDALKQPDPE